MFALYAISLVVWLGLAIAGLMLVFDTADRIGHAAKRTGPDTHTGRYIARILQFAALSGIFSLFIAMYKENMAYCAAFVAQMILWFIGYHISISFLSKKPNLPPKNKT